MINKKQNKKAQVWVETVIYTLVGLAIIGIILGIITPKINEIKNKAAIEQAVVSLNSIDEVVGWAQQVRGRQRIVDYTIKKGSLVIDSTNEKIVYSLDGLKKAYSEVGAEIPSGKLTIKTEQQGSYYKTSIILNYPALDITYGNQETKTLNPASIPYRITIENKGETEAVPPAPGKPKLEFTII